MKTFARRIGFSFFESSISYFSVMIVAYIQFTLTKRPAQLVVWASDPHTGGRIPIQTNSPGTPPTYRFIVIIISLLLCAYKIPSLPTSPDIRRRRGGIDSPPEFFIGDKNVSKKI